MSIYESASTAIPVPLFLRSVPLPYYTHTISYAKCELNPEPLVKNKHNFIRKFSLKGGKEREKKTIELPIIKSPTPYTCDIYENTQHKHVVN